MEVLDSTLDAIDAHDDPTVAYQVGLLEGVSPEVEHALAADVRESPDCNAIIAGCLSLGRHPYRKWQGPHWALVQLAERGHPGGDPRLREVQELVFDWILAPSFLRPNWTLVLDGQPDRVRRCASMEGNVLWASLELGLLDDRLQLLADRLVAFQWPDGGWNCDRRPQAWHSSLVETFLPLRGLAAWVRATGDERARDALDRGLAFVLDHELLYRRNGDLVVPSWGPRPDLIGFPIRFFDVLLALELVVDTDRIGDPRCERALTLLISKRTRDGGFPMEVRRARTSDRVCSQCSFARWGPGGRRRSNPWVTLRALRVLGAAARYDPFENELDGPLTGRATCGASTPARSREER